MNILHPFNNHLRIKPILLIAALTTISLLALGSILYNQSSKGQHEASSWLTPTIPSVTATTTGLIPPTQAQRSCNTDTDCTLENICCAYSPINVSSEEQYASENSAYIQGRIKQCAGMMLCVRPPTVQCVNHACTITGR